VRLIGLLAKALRFHRTARWLSRRKILLQTNVSKRVATRVMDFLTKLDAKGAGIAAPKSVLEHEITEYTSVRNAVAEITTTFLVLISGVIVFQTATPGLFSLILPVAEMRAYSAAVEQFPLGQGLGRAYYSVFSTSLTPWQVVATGVVLAMALSVVTTFAGLIADPLQVLTGTHRRRLTRLLNRLEADTARWDGLAQEHITARFADLSDMALNLWRFIRG